MTGCNSLTERLHAGPIMFEDDLPIDLTHAEYEKWYAKSFVPGGVGCRVGPVVVSKSKGEKK